MNKHMEQREQRDGPARTAAPRPEDEFVLEPEDEPERPTERILKSPSLAGSVAGAVVFTAAVIWGSPAVLLGSAAGFTVYALKRRTGKGAPKKT
jgi:hypothetical protein